MKAEGAKSTAADGATEIHTLVGVGLVVSAFAFNRVVAERDALKAKFGHTLAECRDAYPVPEVGSELDGLWGQAMCDPVSVGAYVSACAVAQQKEIAALKAELEDAKQAARTWENEAERRSDRYTKCAAELERIKALEPTHWQVTQGARSFVMTAAEFNMSTFDYGSFVALYALGCKT